MESSPRHTVDLGHIVHCNVSVLGIDPVGHPTVSMIAPHHPHPYVEHPQHHHGHAQQQRQCREDVEESAFHWRSSVPFGATANLALEKGPAVCAVPEPVRSPPLAEERQLLSQCHPFCVSRLRRTTYPPECRGRAVHGGNKLLQFTDFRRWQEDTSPCGSIYHSPHHSVPCHIKGLCWRDLLIGQGHSRYVTHMQPQCRVNIDGRLRCRILTPEESRQNNCTSNQRLPGSHMRHSRSPVTPQRVFWRLRRPLTNRVSPHSEQIPGRSRILTHTRIPKAETRCDDRNSVSRPPRRVNCDAGTQGRGDTATWRHRDAVKIGGCWRNRVSWSGRSAGFEPTDLRPPLFGRCVWAALCEMGFFACCIRDEDRGWHCACWSLDSTELAEVRSPAFAGLCLARLASRRVRLRLADAIAVHLEAPTRWHGHRKLGSVACGDGRGGRH